MKKLTKMKEILKKLSNMNFYESVYKFLAGGKSGTPGRISIHIVFMKLPTETVLSNMQNNLQKYNIRICFHAFFL